MKDGMTRPPATYGVRNGASVVVKGACELDSSVLLRSHHSCPPLQLIVFFLLLLPSLVSSDLRYWLG